MTKTLLGLALAAALVLFTVPALAAPPDHGATITTTASPDHLVSVSPAPAVVLALESLAPARLDRHRSVSDRSLALTDTVHAAEPAEGEPNYRRPDQLERVHLCQLTSERYLPIDNKKEFRAGALQERPTHYLPRHR